MRSIRSSTSLAPNSLTVPHMHPLLYFAIDFFLSFQLFVLHVGLLFLSEMNYFISSRIELIS
jgi:hypothetical protein